MAEIITPKMRQLPVAAPRPRDRGPTLSDALTPALEVVSADLARRTREAEETELRRAEVAGTEELARARADFDSDTDFVDLDKRFQERALGIKSSIAEGVRNPKVRQAFEMSFDEQALAHLGRVRSRGEVLRRQSAASELDADLGRFSVAAATAPDPETRDRVMATAGDALDRAMEAGIITAAERQSRIAAMVARQAEAELMVLMRDDPAAAAVALEAGGYPAIDDPVDRQRLIGSAQAEAARRRARAEKLAVTEARRIDRDQAQRVDRAAALLEAGRPVENIEALRAEVRGTPHEIELEASIAAARFAGDFVGMTPAEQRSALSERLAAPIDPSSPTALFEGRFRDKLMQIHDRTVKEVRDDLLGHVQARAAADVAPVDFEDQASIDQRIAVAEAAAAQWAAPVRYLTNAERDGLLARLEQAGPDQKVALAAAVVDGFGNRAGPLFTELGQDAPVMGLMGQLVRAGRDDTARLVMRGRDMAKDKGVAKPSKGELARLRSDLLADAFLPGDAAVPEALLEAAEAHFIATAQGIDPKDAAARQAALTASLQAVAGQSRRAADGVITGGLQLVGGRMTLLPPDVAGEDVERALGRVDLDGWQAASVGGGRPSGGGIEYAPRQPVLSDLGGGRYMVLDRRGADDFLLIDSRTGEPFVIDLGRLLRAPEVERGALEETVRALSAAGRATVDAVSGVER